MIASVARIVVLADFLFTATAVVAQPITGVLLASEAGWATTDVQEVGAQPDFRVTFARMATRLLREMSNGDCGQSAED